MAKRIKITALAGAGLRALYWRLAADLGGPVRALRMRTPRVPAFLALPKSIAIGDSAKGQDLLGGRFALGSQVLEIGRSGNPWTAASPSQAYADRLHSFNWMFDIAKLAGDPKALKKDPDLAKYAGARAADLVDSWSREFGHWNPYAWQPRLLTARCFAWLANWQALLDGDKDTPAGAARRARLMRQIARLRHVYKRTPHGTVRMKAAACFVIAGACLPGNQERYLDRGLDWLDDEIDVQILADGGHISRAPEDVAKALHILLVTEAALDARGLQGSKEIRRAIDRLTPMLNFFTATDGRLFSFNGGGRAAASDLAALNAAAALKSKQFGYAPHTNYQRMERNGSVILMDTGATAPRPFDLRTHLAPLAFELTTADGPLIVNCGWNNAQPGQWRGPMRATAAHSTLVLGGRSAGVFFDKGLGAKLLGPAIAREAGPATSSRREQETGTWVEAAHEGYIPPFGLAHRRRLYMDILGADVRGEDSVFVPLGQAPLTRDEIPFKIRFHLHPSVKVTLAQDRQSALLIQPGRKGWRFRTDGGELKIEKSVYLADGVRPARAEQIVISGMAYGDGDGQARSNRVRWSLKRMGEIG